MKKLHFSFLSSKTFVMLTCILSSLSFKLHTREFHLIFVSIRPQSLLVFTETNAIAASFFIRSNTTHAFLSQQWVLTMHVSLFFLLPPVKLALLITLITLTVKAPQFPLPSRIPFPALIFLTQNTTLREIRISLDIQQRWLRLSDSPILDVHRVL